MAADPFLEMKQNERSDIVQKAQSLTRVAVDMSRSLTESEQQALFAYRESIEAIDKELDAASFNFALDAQVAERIQSLSPGGTLARGGYQWPSAGHGLWDLLHQNDREARSRYQAVQMRAAEHMGIGPVAGITPVAGSFENLYVDPVQGPVLNLNPDGMPFLNAIGLQEAPNSLSFMRPRIVDPHFEDGVGTQALQKGELPSKHFTFATDTLDLTTTGGYLNISQQLLSLDPTALGTIVAQLNARLAYSLEKAAVTELSQTTATVAAASGDAAGIQQAIADAAALVFETTKQLPSWIAGGTAGWAKLAGLTDLAGRPLYPPTNPVNPQGTGGGVTNFGISPMGLRFIPTPAIADDTLYVGNSVGFEGYVKRYPVLEAVEPSVLGRQVAVAASAVFYRPTTAEAGPGNVPPAEAAGVVKVTIP